MKNVAFHNLGCKVNSYELDGIQQDFQKAGYNIVDFAQKSDIYIINTCSVTNMADRKSRQMIHKAKKQNPESIVVALGCFVQADPEKSASDPDVDIVIGNNLKSKTREIVEDYLKNTGKDIFVQDLTQSTDYENISIDNSNEHTRAFIKIQDGCNQFCSYCIIPYVRGRIRSRDIDDIVSEVTQLTKKGYIEFVLTGIHLSSYGIQSSSYNEMAGKNFTNMELLKVIDEVSKIEGVERIRLGSLEPRLITSEFINALSSNKKVCPHFHLSLQSGCDEVLKRMNRHYTTDEYKKVLELIRNTYEHPAITTDVIVGFPGETDEEFLITKDYLDEINLYEVHLFKYSRRKGTVADKMDGQLTDKIKSQRSNILSELDKANRNDFAGYYIGKTVEILLEDMEEIDGKSYMVGYTPEYVKCAVTLPDNMTEQSAEGIVVEAVGKSVSSMGAVLICELNG